MTQVRATPAVPFWTCVCRAMNAAHRPYCLWCGASRAEINAEIEEPGDA